jgi:aminomethyltransferase
MPQASPLRRTALNSVHRALCAKMVDFGGWDMPVQYSGILAEHMAVRKSVGVFDVSHMGEIEIRGPQAAQLTDFVTTNAVHKLQTGQAHYTGLLYEHGGFVDDILVHKVAGDDFFLCVNASNQEKDFEHIRAHNRFDATVELTSDRYSQIAIQGPQARATLEKLTPVDLTAIKYYWFTDGEVADVPARIAHTGYTGEDGFEIYIPPAESERIWARVLEAGAARATRCVWKPRWCFTGTRSTLPFRRSKRTSPGSSSSTKASLWDARRCCARKKLACGASSPDLK